MARCSTCNKWPELEQAEPEVDISLDGDIISGTVRIVLQCTQCNDDIKEATFDVEVDVSEHLKHKCPDEEIGEGWTVDMPDIEAMTRQHPPKAQRRTTFYGAQGDIILKCQCGEVEEQIPWSDEIKASHMEELT
jgi:phage FluMu protein Com